MPQTATLVSAQSNTDYVAIHNAGMTVSGNQLTVEFWVLAPAPQINSFLIAKGNASNTGFWIAQDAGGALSFAIGRAGGFNGTGVGGVSPMDGTWHHIAAVREPTFLKLYVDGELWSSGTIASTTLIAASTDNFRLGNSSAANRAFTGAFTEVRIWNVARTQAQIQALMGSTADTLEAGLIAHWTLNEGSGDIAANTQGTGDLALNNPMWVVDAIPPPFADPPPTGGGGGMDEAVLENSLAEWLSTTDGTHLDSAPIRVATKLDFDGVTLDAKLGQLAIQAVIHKDEIGGELAILGGVVEKPEGHTGVTTPELQNQVALHDADVKALVSFEHGETRNTAWNGAQAVIRQVSGRHGYAIVDGLDNDWSVTGDVNNHTDAIAELLQGDMNDHHAGIVSQVNYHTTTQHDLTQAAFDANQHTQTVTLENHMDGNAVDINNYTQDQADRVISSLSGGINGINGNVDAAVNEINNNTNARFTALTNQLTACCNEINANIDAEHVATRAHVTAQADRIIAAGGTGGGLTNTDLQNAVGQINAHTDSALAAAVGQLQGFMALGFAEVNAAIAAATATLAAIQTAITVVVTTTQSIFDRVLQVISVLTDVAALVALIWDAVQQLIPSGGTPTLVGSATWAGLFHFNVEADYYEIDVTEWPAAWKITDLGGALHLGYVGWCAYKSVSGYRPGDKINFSKQVYPVSGIVATGLLIHANAGMRGSVRAYKRT